LNLDTYHADLDYRTPSKRARIDEKPHPSKPHALYQLWLLREQSNTNSFIEQRTHWHASSTRTYWVVTLQDGIKELLHLGNFGISGILITDEYEEAIKAVIEFRETGNSTRLTDSKVPESELDPDEESDQRETLAGVSSSYFNPFSNISKGSGDMMSGFILIGHPGIGEYHNLNLSLKIEICFAGKSVWLVFMLILRLQAGLPTIYQSTSDRMYLFNDCGVFEFPCNSRGNPDWTEIYENFEVDPLTTWALIDSNQDLVQVPLSYQNRFFIVQATSPREDHFAWKNKAHQSTFIYIMKPWTLCEILLGYVVCVHHPINFYPFYLQPRTAASD
jgi:hypothetical protein